MPNLRRMIYVGLVGTVLSGCSAFAAGTDPLPGDGIPPPENINIVLLYDQFSNASGFGASNGNAYRNSTRISDNATAIRYIHSFEINGMPTGVQGYLPYVNFIGPQELGIGDIPAPVEGLPNFGQGRARLSHQSGFLQPNFSVLAYPINDSLAGTYAVIAPWISPPISSFDKNDLLNGSQNCWVYELELGFRKVLLGTPTTQNLSIEVWGEEYLFGDNTHSADVSPTVSANHIPSVYNLFGVHNPLQKESHAPATFHEQPSEEFRVYLPYQFYPAAGAYVSPGFYQSFGGKQTYRLHNGGTIDSGNRTNESQLRLIISSFISRSVALTIAGDYDIAARGQPLDRTIEFRLEKFF
jgi:hypothetical protein